MRLTMKKRSKLPMIKVQVTKEQFPVFRLAAECRTKLLCACIRSGHLWPNMPNVEKDEVKRRISELTGFAVTGKDK